VQEGEPAFAVEIDDLERRLGRGVSRPAARRVDGGAMERGVVSHVVS